MARAKKTKVETSDSSIEHILAQAEAKTKDRIEQQRQSEENLERVKRLWMKYAELSNCTFEYTSDHSAIEPASIDRIAKNLCQLGEMLQQEDLLEKLQGLSDGSDPQKVMMKLIRDGAAGHKHEVRATVQRLYATFWDLGGDALIWLRNAANPLFGIQSAPQPPEGWEGNLLISVDSIDGAIQWLNEELRLLRQFRDTRDSTWPSRAIRNALCLLDYHNIANPPPRPIQLHTHQVAIDYLGDVRRFLLALFVDCDKSTSDSRNRSHSQINDEATNAQLAQANQQDICESDSNVLRKDGRYEMLSKAIHFSPVEKRRGRLHFRPDHWLPIDAALKWQSTTYPRYQTLESINSWRRLIMRHADFQYFKLTAEDIAIPAYQEIFALIPNDKLDEARQKLIDSLSNDEQLLRAHCPQLFSPPALESPKATGHPIRDLIHFINIRRDAVHRVSQVGTKEDFKPALDEYSKAIDRPDFPRFPPMTATNWLADCVAYFVQRGVDAKDIEPQLTNAMNVAMALMTNIPVAQGSIYTEKDEAWRSYKKQTELLIEADSVPQVLNVLLARIGESRDGKTTETTPGRLNPPVENVGEPNQAGHSDLDAQVFGKWTIRPGEASYDGSPFFDIDRTPRQLLIRLAESKERTVSTSRLKEVCGNSQMEDETLRSHISRLNSTLKKALKISCNPVKSVQSGYRLRVQQLPAPKG